MDNERVKARTLLSLKNAAHRLLTQRVGTQAVDRLRGESDDPALPQDVDGFFDQGRSVTAPKAAEETSRAYLKSTPDLNLSGGALNFLSREESSLGVK